MRKLDRTKVSAPPSLSTPSVRVGNEKAAAVLYYGARNPWQSSHKSYAFNEYRDVDVKGALWKLAGGNCAYCENKIYGNGSREVEHYRPKGGIDGLSSHPGYWWLAHEWENLLPTCRDCNKSLKQHIVTPIMTRAEVEDLLSVKAKTLYGKGTQFAIRGTRAVGNSCVLTAEDPLLIDPCMKDPALELSWDFSNELSLLKARAGMHGISPYGDYTINTCALNRAGLVLDRISVLNVLRRHRISITDRLNAWTGSATELQSILKSVDELEVHAEAGQPFSGMASAFIDDIENELEQWRIAKGLPPF
jgi:5-methylcytosine-specific restriction endonuclease McrA